MQVPISQGYCNSFGSKAGACMLVKNGGIMASKQSIAKEKQNYTGKPKNCGNCQHYRSEIKTVKTYFVEEKDKHCSLGEFAVKKTAVCDLWEERSEK